MFSCHNKDKKEREYAELKENQETCKMRFFPSEQDQQTDVKKQ